MHMMMDRMRGRGHNRETVFLSEGRVLTFILPPMPPRRNVILPLAGTSFVILLVGSMVFIMVKKTLKPVDKIIMAAERVGKKLPMHSIQ